MDITSLYQFVIKENMTNGRNDPKDKLLTKIYFLNKISLLSLSIFILIIIGCNNVNINKR